MKLYSHIVSERGKMISKGGNSKLDITITTDRKEVGRLMVTYDEYELTRIIYYPIGGKGGRTILYDEKSEIVK